MIRPYIIDPLESSSIHLDLTLVHKAFCQLLGRVLFVSHSFTPCPWWSCFGGRRPLDFQELL